jgi:flagellar secretion chaperone FliS
MSPLAARGVNSYRQTEIQSRTPLELVVMLYDGALRFTAEAREAMARRDIRSRQQSISRALAIVSELQSTLDMASGGEVAVQLDKLYGFVRDRLVDASLKQDPKPLDEAARVLTTLREGWFAISGASPSAARYMAESPLVGLIDQYRAGLDAEIVILRRLEQVAARQREASTAHDLTALNRAADDREGLMAALVNIEGQLRTVRQTLSASREEARHVRGYAEAVALHSEAIALVSGILSTDEQSLEVLAAAELARRDAARAVEQGETTLAAYRRVMTALPGATLVDRRG